MIAKQRQIQPPSSLAALLDRLAADPCLRGTLQAYPTAWGPHVAGGAPNLDASDFYGHKG